MNNLVRILCLSTLLPSVTAAAIVYDESVDGDFSNNYLSPTAVGLGNGENQIIGALAGGTSDLDLFTITVPDGLFLSSIRVLAFTGGGNGSLMGVQPGPALNTSPFEYMNTGGGEPINYVIFGELDAAEQRDVMPQLVVGLPLGGVSPLPGGEYAFWLNETGAGSTYTLALDVVPEPSSAGLLLVALSGGLLRRVRSQ